MSRIPPRVLRLGQEFDFILAVDESLASDAIATLGTLLQQEIQISKTLAAILRGAKQVQQVRRILQIEQG